MTAPVLQAEGIVAGYTADLMILHGVSVEVAPGEIVAIIGPNGAGKSTLIKAIAGLVKVSAGRIAIDGRETTGTPAHLLAAAGVAYVPQTDNVFATLSIEENLVLGGVTLPGRQARARIEEALARYPMLAERRRQKAGILSGGQRQMLAIARALMTAPRLILLDEPTAGLSPMAAEELFGLIRGLVGGGAAVLMVEQNARAALRHSDRGYVLAEGVNRIEGASDALLADAEIGAIFLGLRPADSEGLRP
ncbi:MAG: ABC transporter ATP-binding protein [Alphaproteobacteria bacterium]|nr:MAG: ABC transporter ATP-binding protein [Alphaproteobacteria bacterium]